MLFVKKQRDLLKFQDIKRSDQDERSNASVEFASFFVSHFSRIGIVKPKFGRGEGVVVEKSWLN